MFDGDTPRVLDSRDPLLEAWVARSQALMTVAAVQRGGSPLRSPSHRSDGAARPETDDVQAWLALRLRQPLPPSGVPKAVQSIARAWAAYDSGRWDEAMLGFEQAWRALLPWWREGEACTELAEVSLGLGCTYLRVGRLACSHGWLLLALREARAARDEWVSVKAYGALGECLLRGGCPTLAFHAFSSSYHLLPPGSGQRARQLTYLGAALSRLGQISRACAALTLGLQMARDGRDSSSEAHARARLLFVGVRHPSFAPEAAQFWVEDSDPAQAPWGVQAYACLGLARLGASLGKTPAQQAVLAQRAAEWFEKGGMHWEAFGAWHWAWHWEPSARGAEQCQLAWARWERLATLPDFEAPVCEAVADRVLAQVTLPPVLQASNGQGKAPLGEPWLADDAWFL